MTNRPRRVAELMKHELADLLSRDFEFGGALVTIHEVDMTPDLRQAHVYVGILGREDLQADAMRKLHRAAHTLAQKISRRVILRNTPMLYFKQDDSVERGVRVLNIIEKIDEVTPPEDPPYPNAVVPKAGSVASGAGGRSDGSDPERDGAA